MYHSTSIAKLKTHKEIVRKSEILWQRKSRMLIKNPWVKFMFNRENDIHSRQVQ
jgi:hypothetical protein